ncbi:MAG: hypothetical protein ABI905_02745 [Betaproteobacteria bacterium]
MKMRVLAVALSAMCTLSFSAIAQTPAAADAPLVKHGCTKPALPDASKKMTVVEKNAVVASMEVFRNCVRAFSDGQEKIKLAKEQEAKTLQDSSQVALAAAKAAKASVDAATAEYNTFSADAVKILNKDAPAQASQGKAEPAPPRPSRNY